MDNEKKISEQDIYAEMYGVVGDTMKWAFEKDSDPSDALNYLFGMYDLASALLRIAHGIVSGVHTEPKTGKMVMTNRLR